jgi:hypothetical protein
MVRNARQAAFPAPPALPPPPPHALGTPWPHLHVHLLQPPNRASLQQGCHSSVGGMLLEGVGHRGTGGQQQRQQQQQRYVRPVAIANGLQDLPL